MGQIIRSSASSDVVLEAIALPWGTSRQFFCCLVLASASSFLPRASPRRRRSCLMYITVCERRLSVYLSLCHFSHSHNFCSILTKLCTVIGGQKKNEFIEGQNLIMGSPIFYPILPHFWANFTKKLYNFIKTCKNRRPYNLHCVGADVKPCSINLFITRLVPKKTCRVFTKWGFQGRLI